MKDPYVYNGTNILINNFDIKDEKQLDEIEANFIEISAIFLKQSEFHIFSIFDGLKIHKILFEAVYSWAGQIRTIDIYKSEPILEGKSIDYVLSSYIKTALEELDNEFKSTDWNNLSAEEKIEKVCYFVSEFWHIHPFREGNSRTTAMFMYLLMKTVGLHINYDFLVRNGKYFRNALVLSSLYSSSQPEYLLGIVADATTMKKINTNKYQAIDGKEVEKYAYTHHTLNRLETIKKPKDWQTNKK